VLRAEFTEPLGLSAAALARALGVATNRVTALLNETRRVTAESALLLARYVGTTPVFWLNLQRAYDLRVAEGDRAIRRRVAAIRPRSDAAA
jgi:addiction module HigA family antidote